MDLSRRSFLKLLSAIPAAVAVAQLPAEAKPDTGLWLTPNQARKLNDLPPIVEWEPEPLLDTYGIYMEVDGVRFGVRTLEVSAPMQVIDVTQIASHQQDYHFGLDRQDMIVSTHDKTALRALQPHGLEVPIKVFMPTPSDVTYTMTAKGVLGLITMHPYNAAGLPWISFCYSLTEMVRTA